MTAVILAALLSVSGLANAVLLLRLRKVTREREQARRAAENADRTLAAFVSQSAEDFFQDGGHCG